VSRVCELTHRTDRAASTVVGYVVALAVSALFLTALTVSLGGLTETHTERMITDQLTVVGETTAGELERVDRLARLAEADRAETEVHAETTALVARTSVELPTQIGGHAYSITVTTDAVIVRSSRPVLTVSVVHRSRVTVGERTVRGGPVAVTYRPDPHDPTAGRIVVQEQ